jgi:hypothetical protein
MLTLGALVAGVAVAVFVAQDTAAVVVGAVVEDQREMPVMRATPVARPTPQQLIAWLSIPAGRIL